LSRRILWEFPGTGEFQWDFSSKDSSALLVLRRDWGGETKFPLTFSCLEVILMIAERYPKVFPLVLWV